MAARRKRGPVEHATFERLSSLPDPDQALVALALRLAQLMDDSEMASAATARELRQTVQSLTVAAGLADQGKRQHLARVVGRIGGEA